MKTILKTVPLCPSCRKPIPGGAPAGLCPACLLAQGAETGDAAGAFRFEPLPVPEVAKLFPQLEILDLIGAGGMGAVYKARQPALDRIVALKLLPSVRVGGSGFAERFNREARALARLNHPNIVAVYEFGDAGGLHYFLMEYVDGANLRLLEQGSRLSPREALQLIPQICDALQYAHDEGVVHRDIKPENVLVDRKGRVKIADFGLAKILGVETGSTRLTAEGQVMGTPHYMAPEQIERPLSVDHRADIYSLGVVLYEMLTGDLPLGKFEPPSRKVRVDVKFDEVVLRALENDPARRYQRASEVKTRVETISPDPATASEQRVEQSDRQYLGWLGLGVIRDDGGVRSICWQRAWMAFGVMFGLISLAFAFVTAFTDRSVLGWIGIKGWPSVIARLLIAAAIASWGVWRTFQSRAEAEPLSRDGLVLPSSQRRWKIGRRLIAASLAVLAWLVFERNWLSPRLEKWLTDRPELQAAVLDVATGTLVARLPGGGEVELLGLSRTGDAAGRWWRPDGRPMTNETLTIAGPADIATPGLEKRDLAFRIAGIPRERDSVIYDFAPAANVSDGGVVMRNGSELSGGWPIRAGWTGLVQTATLRLGYSRDPWRTIWMHNPSEHSTQDLTQDGDPKWTTSLNQIRDDGTDSFLTMVLGPNTKNWRLRVVAVGIDGVERFHARASGTPSGNSTTWTYTFPGMTLKQVKEFQLQARALRWVEFRDVQLHASGGAAMAPGMVVADGAMNGEANPSSIHTDPADLREAKAHLAELRITHGEEHPEIKAAQARIAELERMNREEPKAPADLREAKARLAGLRMIFREGSPEIQQMLARIKVLEGR